MKKILKNKILQFSIVLLVGIFTGWLFFKPGNEKTEEHLHNHNEDVTYTCSMHPKIRQNEQGKCPICGMALIAVSQNSDKENSSPYVFSLSSEAIALANVKTHRITYGGYDKEIILTGKVAVNEQKKVSVTANYSGRIEKLFIDFTGQEVLKGQKLATIYSPDLITAQKELFEAAKFKSTNPAIYNAAKEKLRFWKITDKQIDEIENRGYVLSEFDVISDQSGVVINLKVTNGDYVNKGSLLFEITDLNNLWVLLDAYESDLPLIKTGQSIDISVSSMPGKEFSSTVAFIDPLINTLTRTASVRAEVSNNSQLLKPEMFVKGRIKSGVHGKSDSLVIPNSAVLWTGLRSVVYVKKGSPDNPWFEMREVTIGTSLGQFYVVENGLIEGEEVVSNGLFAIDAAAQLNGNYSMMNRAPDNTVEIPEMFTNQLTAFINQYLELKNVLVKSDFNLAKSTIPKFESAFNTIGNSHLSGKAIAFWEPKRNEIERLITRLKNAGNIEDQRMIFSDITDIIVLTVETFRVNMKTIYVAYCPMALNDTGGFWLSEFEEIRNPYFGDMMLECGEVKKTIQGRVSGKPKSEGSNEHQH